MRVKYAKGTTTRNLKPESRRLEPTLRTLFKSPWAILYANNPKPSCPLCPSMPSQILDANIHSCASERKSPGKLF